MSKIQISGRVQHLPGAWGAAVAARGASVEVIDVDPGGSDDVIFAASTDAEGRFAGTSSEWQDNRTFSVWVQDSWTPPRGHWESRSSPDPTDTLLLKLRIKQGGKVLDVFPFANGAPLPVLLPWGAPFVPKEARALLVVNNTVAAGAAKYRGLYQFLEGSGDAVARQVCGPHYRIVQSLNGTAATLAAFLAALQGLAVQPGIQAVDAILNMHGEDGKLVFAGGAETMSVIGDKLGGLGLAGKLRMLYNTCCYGQSHASTLVKGGFDAAIGGRKVVCNSSSEYPVLLSGWVSGLALRDALAPAQSAALREPLDAFARESLGFSDADSFKLITGDAAVTIGSLAT
jgi:hypothetical protein